MSEEKKAPQNFGTALTKVNDTFMPMIIAQLEKNSIQMSPYAKECVLHAISAINTVLDKAGLTWNSTELDKSTVSDILVKIACFQLNAAASPREVYFQLRNVKTANKDDGGKDIWKKQVEMGIEGDGNDAILARFGRGVERVCQIWKVREGDTFVYPKYKGLDMTPPEWEPSGTGKLSKIVYPVIMAGHDGKSYVEFYISERADVIKNLIAHINNNLMNETFGIVEKRYKATPDQLSRIDAKKKELIAKASSMDLDSALDCPDLVPYISPAWTEPHSREAMIERKMRNNAIKKIPKDFGNGAMETMFEESDSEERHPVIREIGPQANGAVIDIGEESGAPASLPAPQARSEMPIVHEGSFTKEPVPAARSQQPASAPFMEGLLDEE